MPEFTQFIGEDNHSIVEYIAKLSFQYGEAQTDPFLKLRSFSSLLTK